MLGKITLQEEKTDGCLPRPEYGTREQGLATTLQLEGTFMSMESFCTLTEVVNNYLHLTKLMKLHIKNSELS